jgi:hypothetical protein
VGEIDLKVIFAAENSNKFQKTRFWKEKLVEDMVTLGPTNMHLGQPLGTWWEYEGNHMEYIWEHGNPKKNYS